MLYRVPVCPGDNPPNLTATILLATVQDWRASVSGRQSSQAAIGKEFPDGYTPGLEHWRD